MHMHLRAVEEEYILVFSNKKTSEMAGRLRDLYYSVLRCVCFVYLSVLVFSNKKTSEMVGRLRDLYYSVLRRVCFVYLSIVYF